MRNISSAIDEKGAILQVDPPIQTANTLKLIWIWAEIAFPPVFSKCGKCQKIAKNAKNHYFHHIYPLLKLDLIETKNPQNIDSYFIFDKTCHYIESEEF